LEVRTIAKPSLEVQRDETPGIFPRVRAAGSIVIVRVSNEVRFDLEMPGINREWALSLVRAVRRHFPHEIFWNRIEERITTFIWRRFRLFVFTLGRINVPRGRKS